MAFALLSSSNTCAFLILDGIGCLLRFVGTSGLSAGYAAAAALELEAASTGGVDFELDLDDDAAAAAAELACGTFDVDLDDLAADDAREPPLIVVGTFSPSLDEIDIAAALGFLAAGLPLPLSVIDVKGPGMSSLFSLLLVDLDIPRGTGMSVGSNGDGVLVGGGFATLFVCITGIVCVGSPRADLDLGALGGGR